MIRPIQVRTARNWSAATRPANETDAAAQNRRPPTRSRAVPCLIESGFQGASGILSGTLEIRARLLHQAGQGERGETQSLGVRLKDGLTQPIALMQRLDDDGRWRLVFKCTTQDVDSGQNNVSIDGSH
jgi:hypothetical protein